MPTLGYTTPGTAGTTSLENIITGSEFTTPSSSVPFQVNSMSAYFNPSATAFTTKCAIYTAAGALVANSATAEVTGVSGAAARTFTYSGTKPTLSANTAYILVAWCQSRSGTNVHSYDAGSTNQGHTVSSTYGASFPSSVTFTHSTNKYTISADLSYGYSISGSVTSGATVAATMAYNKNPQITGSVTSGATVSATLTYNRHASIAGSITSSATVAATMLWESGGPKTYTIAGSVTSGATVAASMQYNRNASIAGSITSGATVSGTMLFNIHPVITGDITASAFVSAAMQYQGTASAKLAPRTLLRVGV